MRRHYTDLLKDPNNFVAALKSMHSVVDYCTSTGKPHYVFKNKGHYECESARRNGELDGIISWHKKHHAWMLPMQQNWLRVDYPCMGSVGKKKAKRKGLS